MKNIIRVVGCTIIGGFLWTADADAATMNDYCVIPSFIQETILPNLLMILDNSASMYDLAYADKGRKVCSSATTTECSIDADCSGGTCSYVAGSSRQPYYCYDQTYSSASNYTGYFDNTKRYNYNFADETFAETAAAIDSTTCADGANTPKLIAGQLCVVYSAASANAVTKFMASGNYLNWLTASKFDVEKKILTGGKYDGTRLLAESRGCVGQSFIKEALSQDFVNYNSPETNNTNSANALGITFGVRGPYDILNPSAPSNGGQTYLDIYKGAFTRRGDCQQAVTTLTSPTSTLAAIKQATCQCLTGDSNCADTDTIAAIVKTKVSYQQSMQACWACKVSATSPFSCGGTDIGMDEITTVKNQCVSIYNEYATCVNDPQRPCTTSADCVDNFACQYGPTSIVPGNPALMCGNSYEGQYYFYQAAGVANTCTATGGVCGSDADCPDTKKCSKLVGTESAYRNCTADATVCTGAGNQCKSVTNRCAAGAVTSGWYLRPGVTQDQMEQTHRDFCGLFKAMPVTDPTDAPSNTASYDNIPAIMSSTGAEAQLKTPIARLTVRLNKSPAPKGVVSDFSKQVRMGAMTFNFTGSATESGVTIPVTKVCSSDPTRVCSIDIDCGSCTNCCNPATNNLDGAKIVHYIGTGHCSATTATACYINADCPSTETCINDGVGAWDSGLVKAINDIRANSWTPFSEAYYNAIGYYAKVPATGKSRTDLRINAGDFNENRNPSQYPCQSNNILLISDGMSTADRHPDVDNLAKAYTAAGGATSWTTGAGGCPGYGGSVNVDNMAWIGRHRNIQTLTTTDDGTEPAKKAERVTSYVVYNGDSNGLSGECDSKTLLEQTATNGGTILYQAVDPAALDASLRDAFRDISGGAASGTAASILSNSEGSGANILQAVFFPKKDFVEETSANWIGEMQNLWYFVDPYIGNSSVREDTGYTEANRAANVDHVMNLVSDYVAEFYFDAETNDTKARLKKDTDGNGTGDVLVTSADEPDRITATVPGIVPADSVASIWRAGKLLWDRDLSANPQRVLYTYMYGATATGCSGPFTKTTLFNLLTFNWATESDDNKCVLQKYLAATSQDEAKNIIRYIHGYDTQTDGSPIVINAKEVRDRSVKLTAGGPEKVWKLGDIVSSTPRVQSSGKLNNYHLEPSAGYADTSYANDDAKTGYANSTDYKSRGMVYAGANDGMLHAFKLGTLTVKSQGAVKAVLSGTNLGEEQWAFIPRNVLPYLKYLADPAYSHLYLVDGSTKIVDASVGYDVDTSVAAFDGAVCAADTYWDCKKVASTTSWRTILIGSMGIGGASRLTSDATCTDKVATGSCVKSPLEDAGFSSYYALDVTNPASPQFLWDFSDPSMGYSTTGAAVARIAYTDAAGKPYRESNGRWYAVIGNGPTGPIDTATHQFLGNSDKNLKIFVLDLKLGPKSGFQFEHDSTLVNAFAGSLADATIDTDRWKKISDGFYSDDALYFGYSQCTANCATAEPTWNGGVARLLTHENPDPAQWELTQLISNTGPVTSSIGRLQDRRNHKLWLYFGTGRYFFKEDDKSSLARKLIGVKDPCYKGNDDIVAPTGDACRTIIDFSSGTGFVDQSTISATAVDKGWYITLDAENVPNAGYAAERSITDPVAMTNGAVFFTTFKPSVDICNFGGHSFMWGVKYDTGGVAPSSALKAKALVQVSTGSFEEVDLSTALTAEEGRKMGTPMVGKPPNDPPPIVSPAVNKPLKRVIHIREK